MLYQPKLDFGESAEAEREIDRRMRADRARAFEAAAVRIGIRPNEIGFKLAGMLAVYAASPSMRQRGLTGLRWVGTTAELANDARLKCSADSVSKLLRRFKSAGLIDTWQTVDDRGRVCGIGIELNMPAINATSATTAQDSSHGTGPGAYPGTGPVIDHGTDPGKSTLYRLPFLPSNSEIPPPPTKRETLERKPEPSAAAADWEKVSQALKTAGVARIQAAIDAAKHVGATPTQIENIVAEYQRHKSKFDSPGAIVDRIRSGAWPVDLPTAETVQRSAEYRDHKRRALDFEKARSAVIREARAAGRWAAMTDAEIDAAANARLGFEPLGVTE